MKVNRLLLLAAASVLIGGGSFAACGKVLANQFLVAQNSVQPTGQQEGWKNPRRADFAQRLGLTDAQQAQLKQIHEATHQQIDAIFTPEQKSQIEAIRQDAKSKMDAVLSDQQRQQLQASEASSGQQKGPGFARISGLTDDQKAQLKQIHEATHQQIDAIFTPEQKSRMEAIRQDAKSKMDAVLSDQQRQQLQQLHQQRQQSLRQQS